MTTTDELERVLEDVLTQHFGRSCVVTALRREPYEFSTSFALEDIEVELADGTVLRLILKDLGAAGLLQGARTHKPGFVYEPRRELLTYQRLLSRAGLGTATCYGVVAAEASARFWLLLEKVEARELYQVGDLGIWVEVAVWLAGMHRCAALEVEPARHRNPHLLDYDGGFYRTWLDRATGYIGADGSPAQQRALSVVAEGLELALERMAELPPAFVHGEFYASNVLVGGGSPGRRICPVDWEMAGIGPGLLDLGALCAGWDEESRRAIAGGYLRAWGPAQWPSDETSFWTYLECCELCLAVQWSGWAPRWQAPPEHTRDWWAEAARLARGLRR